MSLCRGHCITQGFITLWLLIRNLFVFNLLGTKSHRLRNVALFTADGLNEESLINTARALKALGIDPQRVVIDNEEVEL